MTTAALDSYHSLAPAHICRAVAPDSWWVYRHSLGPDGQPLPWGRVVHYCRSEAEALDWVREQKA